MVSLSVLRVLGEIEVKRINILSLLVNMERVNFNYSDSLHYNNLPVDVLDGFTSIPTTVH